MRRSVFVVITALAVCTGCGAKSISPFYLDTGVNPQETAQQALHSLPSVTNLLVATHDLSLATRVSLGGAETSQRQGY